MIGVGIWWWDSGWVQVICCVYPDRCSTKRQERNNLIMIWMDGTIWLAQLFWIGSILGQMMRVYLYMYICISDMFSIWPLRDAYNIQNGLTYI